MSGALASFETLVTTAAEDETEVSEAEESGAGGLGDCIYSDFLPATEGSIVSLEIAQGDLGDTGKVVTKSHLDNGRRHVVWRESKCLVIQHKRSTAMSDGDVSTVDATLVRGAFIIIPQQKPVQVQTSVGVVVAHGAEAITVESSVPIATAHLRVRRVVQCIFEGGDT